MHSPPPPPPPPLPPAPNPPMPQPHADPGLDFLSPDFVPLRALHTLGLQPPNVRVVPLDNVVKCRAILPEELSDSRAAWLAAHPRRVRSEETKAAIARSRARLSHARRRTVPAPGAALDALAAAAGRSGPCQLLARAYRCPALRVRVVTRHAHGVRGVAVGRLEAFDKFWNLVLRNVDEEYTVRLRVVRTLPLKPAAGSMQANGIVPPAAGGDEAVAGATKAGARERTRSGWKQEARRRHLKLAVLRGDSIVLISLVGLENG